ncbi:MAG: HAD family hydrolase [Sedimentisphaeraceae bacterium JB056]
MIKAVIFDFDGVIADSEELHFRAFNQTLASYGVLVDQKVYWQKYLGFTDREAYEQMSIDHGLNFTDSKIEWLIDEKAVVFDQLVHSDGVIIDGVLDFLKHLKDSNIPMAICSGATLSDIESVFESTKKRLGIDLAKHFEVIVTADEVKNGKPDPEGYLITVEKLREILGVELEASDCVVIEDSHWGIEAAKAAEMKVIGVTNSYPAAELENAADIVVDNLRSLSINDIGKKLSLI